MLVGTNSRQTLEHLISFDRHALLILERARNKRTPDRMRMEDRTGLMNPGNRQMERGFIRWPSFAGDYPAASIHFQDFLGPQTALVSAARSDREPQRIVVENDTEVAARSEDPAAPVEIGANLRDRRAALLVSRLRLTLFFQICLPRIPDCPPL